MMETLVSSYNKKTLSELRSSLKYKCKELDFANAVGQLIKGIQTDRYYFLINTNPTINDWIKSFYNIDDVKVVIVYNGNAVDNKIGVHKHNDYEVV